MTWITFEMRKQTTHKKTTQSIATLGIFRGGGILEIRTGIVQTRHPRWLELHDGTFVIRLVSFESRPQRWRNKFDLCHSSRALSRQPKALSLKPSTATARGGLSRRPHLTPTPRKRLTTFTHTTSLDHAGTPFDDLFWLSLSYPLTTSVLLFGPQSCWLCVFTCECRDLSTR